MNILVGAGITLRRKLRWCWRDERTAGWLWKGTVDWRGTSDFIGLFSSCAHVYPTASQKNLIMEYHSCSVAACSQTQGHRGQRELLQAVIGWRQGDTWDELPFHHIHSQSDSQTGTDLVHQISQNLIWHSQNMGIFNKCGLFFFLSLSGFDQPK